MNEGALCDTESDVTAVRGYYRPLVMHTTWGKGNRKNSPFKYISFNVFVGL